MALLGWPALGFTCHDPARASGCSADHASPSARDVNRWTGQGKAGAEIDERFGGFGVRERHAAALRRRESASLGTIHTHTISWEHWH